MNRINSILLIDDNQAEYTFNKIIIEEMKITNNIHVSENGLSAIEYLMDKTTIFPELIILDLYMPKMDGWEFLMEYRKLNRPEKENAVILVLSNSSDPDEVNRAKEYKEVNYFLLKPLTKYAIEEIMERFF
jgi:CheY-like chemotaxis protein